MNSQATHRRQRAYVDWPTFCTHATSRELRASMMDLHWFLNNGTLKVAVRELLRFVAYGFRALLQWRPAAASRTDVLIALDTPGVGGVETVLPLLRCKPSELSVAIAATRFVARDARLRDAVSRLPNVRLLDIESRSAGLALDATLLPHVARLAWRHPRLLPAVALFMVRRCIYVAAARAVLRGFEPKAVVVFNERMLPSACFSEVARSMQVKTFAVQHGNFVENYLPVMVDHYLTWGLFHSQWLQRHSACRTTPIGAPRLDDLSPRSRPWTVPPRVPHLVFFSQVGSATVPPEWISCTRRMILQLAQRGAFRVTVKLHPLDSEARWATEGPMAGAVRYLGGHVDLAAALADADVMCSFYSTVLVEGLLHDLPVVQLNPYPESVPSFPSRHGIVAVRDDIELEALVASWRESEPLLQQLRTHQASLRQGYFSNLGHAGTRFWEELASQAQPGTKHLQEATDVA